MTEPTNNLTRRQLGGTYEPQVYLDYNKVQKKTALQGATVTAIITGVGLLIAGLGVGIMWHAGFELDTAFWIGVGCSSSSLPFFLIALIVGSIGIRQFCRNKNEHNNRLNEVVSIGNFYKAVKDADPVKQQAIVNSPLWQETFKDMIKEANQKYSSETDVNIVASFAKIDKLDGMKEDFENSDDWNPHFLIALYKAVDALEGADELAQQDVLTSIYKGIGVGNIYNAPAIMGKWISDAAIFDNDFFVGLNVPYGQMNNGQRAEFWAALTNSDNKQKFCAYMYPLALEAQKAEVTTKMTEDGAAFGRYLNTNNDEVTLTPELYALIPQEQKEAFHNEIATNASVFGKYLGVMSNDFADQEIMSLFANRYQSFDEDHKEIALRALYATFDADPANSAESIGKAFAALIELIPDERILNEFLSYYESLNDENRGKALTAFKAKPVSAKKLIVHYVGKAVTAESANPFADENEKQVIYDSKALKAIINLLSLFIESPDLIDVFESEELISDAVFIGLLKTFSDVDPRSDEADILLNKRNRVLLGLMLLKAPGVLNDRSTRLKEEIEKALVKKEIEEASVGASKFMALQAKTLGKEVLENN